MANFGQNPRVTYVAHVSHSGVKVILDTTYIGCWSKIFWTFKKMNTVCASVNHLMMGIFNLSGEIRCIFESDDQ